VKQTNLVLGDERIELPSSDCVLQGWDRIERPTSNQPGDGVRVPVSSELPQQNASWILSLVVAELLDNLQMAVCRGSSKCEINVAISSVGK
jgi:hypothetical protein